MRTILALVLTSVTAVSLHAQFLVRDQQYRCPPGDEVCKGTVKTGLSSFEQRKTQKGNSFTINYVEYDDNGRLFNPQQLKDALDQVRQARGVDGSQGVLVVVYVHGWQNNDNEVKGSCQDVCLFRDTLLVRLADAQAESGGTPLKVVGVYLAWRGLTFTVEPFKHIVSYWPRRSVARHVGQTGMFDALTGIENVVKEKRENYVLVLAGHSFGARVLENAADTSEKGRTGFMLEYRKHAKTPAFQQQMSLQAESEEARALHTSLPADLIVYVNAATASTVTRRTIQDLQETCRTTPQAPICGADPLYLAFTSRKDYATGLIMPVANLVFPMLSSDHLHLFSAADTPWLHTHQDPVPGCQPAPSVCFTVTEGEKSVTESLDRISGKHQIPGSGHDPFWIFNVKKEISSGHSDVWNDSVTDLVTQIIVRNKRYQSLSQQMALRAH